MSEQKYLISDHSFNQLMKLVWAFVGGGVLIAAFVTYNEVFQYCG